jgi:hypothetical protein
VRKPDLTIYTLDREVYLERWHLIPRNTIFNIYYHVMSASDDDRALHDHKAHNISIVLSGGYWEHIKGKRVWRAPGSIVLRRAATPHRIELADGKQARTIFIKFPDFRRWGFTCPQGWVDAADFNDDSDGESRAGKGCG